MSALLELDPSTGVIALERQVLAFEMPGTGIPNFKMHSHAIARAGIYDLASHHEQILQPVILRHYKIAEIEGLSPEAEKARESLLRYVSRVEKAAKRIAARRDSQADEPVSV